MKKIIYLFLIVISLLILDNSLIPFFSINYIYPSILFVFIISYSIINGYIEAILISVLAGVFQDLYFSNLIGINMITNMLVCILGAKIGNSIFKEKSIIPVISTFSLSILKGLMVFGILYLTKMNNGDLSVIFYRAIYDTVLAIFIYKITFKFSETKAIKKEWRF